MALPLVVLSLLVLTSILLGVFYQMSRLQKNAFLASEGEDLELLAQLAEIQFKVQCADTKANAPSDCGAGTDIEVPDFILNSSAGTFTTLGGYDLKAQCSDKAPARTYSLQARKQGSKQWHEFYSMNAVGEKCP